jgi:hypothetical protein
VVIRYEPDELQIEVVDDGLGLEDDDTEQETAASSQSEMRWPDWVARSMPGPATSAATGCWHVSPTSRTGPRQIVAVSSIVVASVFLDA